MTIDSVHFWPDGAITAFRRFRRVGTIPGTDTPDIPEILAGLRPETRFVSWSWTGDKAERKVVPHDQFIRYLKQKGHLREFRQAA